MLVAAKDKMDLAVNIAIGSSAQIALFVAPVLVLVSFVLGPFPMALVFNGFELGAVLLAVIIANHVTNEGESTWYEGLQLLAVYVVLAWHRLRLRLRPRSAPQAAAKNGARQGRASSAPSARTLLVAPASAAAS